MPRGLYLRFTLGFVVGLPALLTIGSHLAIAAAAPGSTCRTANTGLRPSAGTRTVSYLRAHMARFGAVLLVFLCYVHWLGCPRQRDSAATPVESRDAGGLAAFIVFRSFGHGRFCAVSAIAQRVNRYGARNVVRPAVTGDADAIARITAITS